MQPYEPVQVQEDQPGHHPIYFEKVHTSQK